MVINNDTIIKDTNPLIREKSEDVNIPLSKEDEATLWEMLEYVKNSTIPEIAERDNLRPAVGISAIQIGVKKKMTAVVLKDENGDIEYEFALVNPKIVSYSMEKAYLPTGEGCLSVEENHQGLIYRPARIKVKAYDLIQNKNITIIADDYLAIVLQHEFDHFKGTLFYDHINKDNPFLVDENAIRIE